ncbi:Asp-tRNA(Asn)/Glu-tRNA(Gln) amidotransferase subunit GatC [Gemmatimonas sp.]|uniref:Asp-tRNA(Asn)/Glu-tRNA(Gln) amidotransferase subunit GatC n=1 Tax=Gemmatimonas sp. TaxID=1962908 RepID=UPI00286D86A0|nr:Asp-tRNA(Asn)/Glu-tRNA(Gln) amidotransferase subunit GatC [Gemmatimonas sp.]
MSVSNEDVLHVAQLARLAIDDARLPGLVAELNGILQHMDALQQATIPQELAERDVAGMPLRDDGAPPVALQRTREAFAPATREGFFLVPRLATHGDVGSSAEDDA